MSSVQCSLTSRRGKDARRLLHFMGISELALTPDGATGDTHMSQDTQRDRMSKKRVVYTMPGMEAVAVRRDEQYRVTDVGALAMDVYYPPDSKAGVRTPAVLF